MLVYIDSVIKTISVFFFSSLFNCAFFRLFKIKSLIFFLVSFNNLTIIGLSVGNNSAYELHMRHPFPSSFSYASYNESNNTLNAFFVFFLHYDYSENDQC